RACAYARTWLYTPIDRTPPSLVPNGPLWTPNFAVFHRQGTRSIKLFVRPVELRMRLVPLIACTIFLFCTTIARASEHPSLKPAPLVSDDTPAYVFALGVGGGRYGGDGVVQLRPGFHVRLKNTHLGKDGRLFGMDSSAPLAIDIVAPMHLTVKDAGLKDAVWRSTEYDQESEFFSLLRR